MSFIPTGREINGFTEIELTEGPFKGIKFCYEGMQFGDQENEDGTMNMHFDYTITEGQPPKKLTEFENAIGDLLLLILEKQIADNETVYYGGVDEENND